MKILGGLHIRQFSIATIEPKLTTLGQDPYVYAIIQMSAGSEVELQANRAYCIHAYAPSNTPTQFKLPDGKALEQNQTAWIHLVSPKKLRCESGNALMLLGSRPVPASAQSVQVFNENQVKHVAKPWGYELWLTGEAPPHFAFKKIFIKAGTKTSLQYHVKKRETNFLVHGTTALYYNPNPLVEAADFKPADVARETLEPCSVIDVYPNHIHRLEAISDILLFEVSTPEVDDVVRITDDSGRKDGRIESEHKA